MKRVILFTFLLSVLVCIFALCVSAVEIDGVSYTLTKGENGADNTATVNSHKNKTLEKTDIVIPEYVEYEGEKYYVTSMSSTTFESTNITSVIFDENCRITVIPQWAFKGCTKLTYMDLHDAITTISSDAFTGNINMVLAGGALPTSLTSIAGNSFSSCRSHGITTLVVPEGVTEFVNDTGLQHAGTIKTIVFMGEMTKVSLQYYSDLSVYFAANSVNDLNAKYLYSFMEADRPYYGVSLAEKYDGNNYSTKTDGSWTISCYSNNNYNSSGGTKTDANGNTVAPVNVNQDIFYFCGDNKVAFAIRNSNIAGDWNSYLAVYDAVVDDTTYKLAPHLKGEATFEPDSCYAIYKCLCCNDVVSKVLSKDAPGHVIGEIISMNYTNGYFESGDVQCKCAKCETKCERNSEALFESLGYSTSSINGVNSMTQGFKINKEAIETYKQFYPEFELGVIVAGNTTGEEFAPDFTNAKVVSSVIALDNDYIDIRVIGISDATADKNIVFCLYVTENEETHFLDDGKTLQVVVGTSYNKVVETGK